MSSNKLLHTMLRVGDLDKSIHFYTKHLGMQVLKRKEFEEARFTLVFLGYEDNGDVQIELTHNWDTSNYEMGNAYGHIAIGVEDIHGLCTKLKADGITITREPGPMKGTSVQLAFVKDPDGYPIEFIQR